MWGFKNGELSEIYLSLLLAGGSLSFMRFALLHCLFAHRLDIFALAVTMIVDTQGNQPLFFAPPSRHVYDTELGSSR